MTTQTVGTIARDLLSTAGKMFEVAEKTTLVGHLENTGATPCTLEVSIYDRGMSAGANRYYAKVIDLDDSTRYVNGNPGATVEQAISNCLAHWSKFN